jgi:HD-GYP domain-containing protein (c-di-GMP phosphodiesterase class II)
LSIRQVAIDVANVTKGMYVSQLDRPWLETPFVFQGFEIREQSEIEMLQKYCSTVYIDVDRGDISSAQVKQLLAMQQKPKRKQRDPQHGTDREPSKLLRWLKNLLLKMGYYRQAAAVESSRQEGYRIQATVRGEAGPAREAYQQLAEHHQQMMERAMVKSEVQIGELRHAVQPAVDSVLRNPNAMAWTVFSRKSSSANYNRSVGTAILCLLFGRQLQFERGLLEELAMGGMLLDIGNSRIPKSIAATTGAISDEQRGLLRQHVELGLEILACSKGVPDNVVNMLRHHHERYDGSGYPEGLYGSRIPVFGRIAGIVDCYDAMTSENPYSKPMAAYDAARSMNESRGKEFAAEVVEQFLTAIGMFPVGSLVELNDGSIGVVLEQNPNNVLRPKVMLLLDRDRTPLPQKKILEMRDLPLDATQSNALWIIKGHEHGAFGIDPVNIFK